MLSFLDPDPLQALLKIVVAVGLMAMAIAL